MRKWIALIGLVSMASTGFAQSLSCNIDVYTADTGGLMPIKDKIAVTASIQTGDEMNADKCSPAKGAGLGMIVCARESDFIGGFEVGVIANIGDMNEMPDVSSATLGSLRSGKGLTQIQSDDRVLQSVQNRLSKAKIEIPSALNGDSLQIDEAVAKAVSKGILTKGEPVVLLVQDCKLQK